MTRLTLMIVAASLSACLVPAAKQQTVDIPLVAPLEIPFIATMPPSAFFVFPMKTEDSMGRAFIAGGYMFTATHVVEDPDLAAGEHDVQNLGPSPIDGLPVSFDELCAGSLLHYWTPDRGIMPMVITYLQDDEYVVSCMKPIHSGDSGSPVLNARGEVVGVVSRMFTYLGGGYGGIIERLVPQDLVLETPLTRTLPADVPDMPTND